MTSQKSVFEGGYRLVWTDCITSIFELFSCSLMICLFGIRLRILPYSLFDLLSVTGIKG